MDLSAISRLEGGAEEHSNCGGDPLGDNELSGPIGAAEIPATEWWDTHQPPEYTLRFCSPAMISSREGASPKACARSRGRGCQQPCQP
jgi:hypothetical protein